MPTLSGAPRPVPGPPTLSDLGSGVRITGNGTTGYLQSIGSGAGSRGAAKRAGVDLPGSFCPRDLGISSVWGEEAPVKFTLRRSLSALVLRENFTWAFAFVSMLR